MRPFIMSERFLMTQIKSKHIPRERKSQFLIACSSLDTVVQQLPSTLISDLKTYYNHSTIILPPQWTPRPVGFFSGYWQKIILCAFIASCVHLRALSASHYLPACAENMMQDLLLWFRPCRSRGCAPINGDECFYWRTTGCFYGDKCRFKHIPDQRGRDKKPWQP